MARFAVLAFLAAAVAGAAAAADEQLVFPGIPSDKRWDWKDCGKPFPVRSLHPVSSLTLQYKAPTLTSFAFKASPSPLTLPSVART